MQLLIRDETTSGSITNELTLDVLTESITVRELIRSRVYQEVDDHNRRVRTEAAEYKGLITPTDTERTLNGVRQIKVRQIDFQKQFDAACEAFSRNGFFILVNDHQAEDLDEVLELKHDTAVSFVKLTQLVGG